MTQLTEKFDPFAKRMQTEGVPDIVIKSFKFYYNQLLEGQTGLIPEANIKPVETIPDSESISERKSIPSRTDL